MADNSEILHYEIQRLREIVERQYLELAWQQSELRSRSGKAVIVQFDAGPIARSDLTGNAGLMQETAALPPEEAWPTGNVPANSLIPNCGFASYATNRDQSGVIAISVCGLDAARVEQIAAMVEERLRRARNFRPVFLMDISRTGIFRRRGFAFEYIATCSEIEKRNARKLAAFNAQRVEFLKRKWGFLGIINCGARAIEPNGTQARLPLKGLPQQAVNSAVDRLVNEASRGSSARTA